MTKLVKLGDARPGVFPVPKEKPKKNRKKKSKYDYNGISIIEDTPEARDDYGHGNVLGELFVGLEEIHMTALCEGKCLAVNNGEYTTWIILDSISVTHPKPGDIVRIPENATIISSTDGKTKTVMLNGLFPIGIIDALAVPDGMMRV